MQGPNNLLQMLLGLLIIVVLAGGVLWIAQLIRKKVNPPGKDWQEGVETEEEE